MEIFNNFQVTIHTRPIHRHYWCMDSHKPVIDKGKKIYPQANFVHYDRYSSEFNPQGTRSLAIPREDAPFDLILAFSVFTHIHQVELLELVAQLRDMLNPGGLLAFTFTDASYNRQLSDPTLQYDTGIRHQLETNRRHYPNLTNQQLAHMVDTAGQAPWCLLIEDQLHPEPGEHLSHQNRRGVAGESYCVYYSAAYMAKLLPDAKIFPPVAPEWQYCCVLNKLGAE